MTRRAHEVMADLGAFEFLQDIAAPQPTTHALPALTEKMARAGVVNCERLREEMLQAHLLQQIGPDFGASRHGRRVAILLDAINGGDIEGAISKLRRLSEVIPQYELIRNSVTEPFFDSLLNRPGFRRLYICSPWINLSPRQLAILRRVMRHMTAAASVPPELKVITLPNACLNEDQQGGVKPLIEMGAEVFSHPRLHTKLYIREPGDGVSQGPLLAIIGSKNLTQTNNLELGIRINGDSALINDLIRYFLELSAICKEGVE